MQIPDEWHPVEDDVEEYLVDDDVENVDVFEIFNHITAGTVEDYNQWCSVVWCGVNLGLSQGEGE